MLKGSSVELKLIEYEDLEDIFEMRNSSYEYFYEFPISFHNHLLWWEGYKKSLDLMFVIKHLKTHDSVGMVGLSRINLRNRHAEFGRFIVIDEYRGLGYGKETIELVLEYAFNHLNLNKIYLDTLFSNKEALSLYKKVGFIEYGSKIQHIFKNGEYKDLICMYILKEKWRLE